MVRGVTCRGVVDSDRSAVRVVGGHDHLVERNVLVWPSLVPDDGLAWIGAIQIGIAIGFLGAFVLVFQVFSRVFPTLPLPDRS